MNRLDEVIIFNALTRTDIEKIVNIQLADVGQRLLEKGIKFSLTDAAKSHLARAGYDPNFGARPLKRLIQSKILNSVAERMIGGVVHAGSRLLVDEKGGELVVEVKSEPTKTIRKKAKSMV